MRVVKMACCLPITDGRLTIDKQYKQLSSSIRTTFSNDNKFSLTLPS